MPTRRTGNSKLAQNRQEASGSTGARRTDTRGTAAQRESARREEGTFDEKRPSEAYGRTEYRSERGTGERRLFRGRYRDQQQPGTGYGYQVFRPERGRDEQRWPQDDRYLRDTERREERRGPAAYGGYRGEPDAYHAENRERRYAGDRFSAADYRDGHVRYGNDDRFAGADYDDARGPYGEDRFMSNPRYREDYRDTRDEQFRDGHHERTEHGRYADTRYRDTGYYQEPEDRLPQRGWDDREERRYPDEHDRRSRTSDSRSRAPRRYYR